MTAKKTAHRQGFKTGEAIVYPAHGVGRITAIEEQEIAGYKLELFVVSFEKDKMVLRVPTAKAASVGMRKLAEPVRHISIVARSSLNYTRVILTYPSATLSPCTPNEHPACRTWWPGAS